MKKVIYTGGFTFPGGSASAPRVLAIGKALRAAGYDIIFHGRSKPGDTINEGIFQGFPWRNSIVMGGNPVKNALASFDGPRIVRALQENASDDVAAIIVYGSYARFILPIIRYARPRGIKVIADVVEWYNYRNLRMGRFGPIAMDVHAGMTWAIPKCDGIIAISSYLEEYYRKRGKTAIIRMPPMVDLDDARWPSAPGESFSPDTLNLVYAGIPGRKDLITNIMHALLTLACTGAKIRLHLLGPTRNQLLRSFANDPKLLAALDEPWLVYHGPVEQEKVPSMLSRADFSILLRPCERYAHAGFPTKVVESLAAGVPVITNITSDLGHYIHDGQEGLIIPECSRESCMQTLQKALALTTADRMAMRAAARARAATSLDYRCFIEPVGTFMDSVLHA